ncbi:aldehyde dehydrogenase family protein [Rhodococcus sp. C3V]|uniref:aldehyde dehydrogenase family protein n=1 Tax=Rhodococcus sp. C3V TaxID=3034165 RepID=UPI0023E327B8|nr:aldehyde dehydrogenase family protein [Rhodococcus sp. C3V]MDF3320121.1 aldehyde dehydrogenase family protein [Rhodococcus sp. C3V]
MTTLIDTLDPSTGEIIESVPVMTEEEVLSATALARDAGIWWREQGFAGRRACLLAWRRYLARHASEIIDLLHRENGKPRPDAALELLLSLEHITWTAKNAGKILRRETRSPGLLMSNFSAHVEHLPFGVVGVLGPWNYPLYTPNGSIATALAAGNTVVFKPSEYTPTVARLYVDAFARANPQAPEGILSLITGNGDTGAHLCRAGIDKMAFTGSTATGRKVMTACAEQLVPVVLELGGKDAAIVLADADLRAAADAIAFGAMGNGGQTCVGIERVYVERNVREQFLAELTAALDGLQPGSEPDSAYGPMTMPSQIEIVRRHVTRAIDDGARPVIGGMDSIGDRYITPIVLLDPPHHSVAIQEETFGPTVTVTTVDSPEEAVRLANDVGFGLAGSVFSRRRGTAVARMLDTGQVSINSVLGFAAIAALPLGGRGDSGFGRIHGQEGLREFTRTRSIATQRFPIPGIKLLSFRRPGWINRLLPRIIHTLHGR